MPGRLWEWTDRSGEVVNEKAWIRLTKVEVQALLGLLGLGAMSEADVRQTDAALHEYLQRVREERAAVREQSLCSRCGREGRIVSREGMAEVCRACLWEEEAARAWRV